MKKILLALLLACQSANAVNLPQASSVALGGGPADRANSLQSFTIPLANVTTLTMVTICGEVVSSSAGGYYGFYSQASPSTGATSYQVPAGKSFYALSLFMFDNTSGNPSIQYGYGTVALATEGGSAPTGTVPYGAVAGVEGLHVINTPTPYGVVGMQFPASSYPYWRPSGSAHQQGTCIQGVVQ